MLNLLLSCLGIRRRRTPSVTDLRSRYQRWVCPKLGSGQMAFYFERQDLFLESNEWVKVTEEDLEYRKDSFEDRFNDAICEIILGYLDLNDKIRLQWVCPQWRRVIFTKVTQLSIMPFLYHPIENRFLSSDQSLAFPSLKCVDLFRLIPVLRWSPNIRSITGLFSIDNRDEVIEAIIDFCPNLEAIETDFMVKNRTLDMFLKKFGNNMKKIVFTVPLGEPLYARILRRCPVIEVIGLSYLTDDKVGLLFDGDELLTKNLKTFYFCSNLSTERIGVVLQNNKQTLRSVGILVWNSAHLYEDLLNLSNLKKLFINTLCNRQFVECISRLATKCPQLVKMKVIMDKEIQETTNWIQFFIGVNALTTLKSLKLHQFSAVGAEIVFPLVSEPLNRLKSLTSLKIVANCIAIDDQFFESIDINLPKLQKLFLQCRHISGHATRSVVKLRYLRSLVLGQILESYLSDIAKTEAEFEYRPDLLSDADVIELIRNTRKLRRIFVTTLSPNRLMCDLIDSEIELLRQGKKLEKKSLFAEVGKDEVDLRSQRPDLPSTSGFLNHLTSDPFNRKKRLTSDNWML